MNSRSTSLPFRLTYRDAASQNPRLERTKNPVGLMLLKRQSNNNNDKRVPKCEAYAWNTDFNQRSGSIFHGAFYHSLTSRLPFLQIYFP